MNSGTGPANAGPFLLRLGQIPETSLLQPVISLPVDSIIPDLLSALQQSNCLVLKAPAGAGKTTRVPPALLQSGLAGSGQIVMLEPRRLAARTAAARMAFEHGQKVGQQFGFRVRFEEAVSRETRVLTVTEGVLLRRLQDDPELRLQPAQRAIAVIHPVDPNATGSRLVKSASERNDRTLAAAGRADQGDGLAGGDHQADPVQDGIAILTVAQAHIPVFDAPRHRGGERHVVEIGLDQGDLRLGGSCLAG